MPERKTYSREGFVDALLAWIVTDDQVCGRYLLDTSSTPAHSETYQSLNVIESQELRHIFLMLRKELKDTDIPHHSTLRNRIEEVVKEHLVQLEKDMSVSAFQSSNN